MKKIAIINQRYGLEVNGGSEYYTRLIAEHMSEIYDIDILTTKAMDYTTWKNIYEKDEEYINNVHVLRFKVDKERNMNEFARYNEYILANPLHTLEEEHRWSELQGPLSKDLINYIRDSQGKYDTFIFVTYLYYLTVQGMKIVNNKSILIPTAHDEPYIYFKMYNNIFTYPKGIIYLTDEEREFVNARFNNKDVKSVTAAVGIELPKQVSGNEFKEKYKLDEYIIYVGRIDEGKGCNELFDYFCEYKRRNNSNLKLVLLGKTVMDIPISEDIISLGFVSDEDKYNGISGSKALILPSYFESLSISVLEAMSLSIPVIVNGNCEVLKGHCVKSNGGLYYKNYFEFEGILNWFSNNDSKGLSINAKLYVDKYFRWKVIKEKIKQIIDYTIGENGEY